jgi:hypothetical protein
VLAARGPTVFFHERGHVGDEVAKHLEAHRRSRSKAAWLTTLLISREMVEEWPWNAYPSNARGP